MKSLLNKILHPGWVAAIAILYNKIYRSVATTFIFKSYPVDKIIFIHQERAKPADLLPQTSLGLQDLSPIVREAFDSFLAFEQSEFFARIDGCIIEPKYGWPMTSNYQLIYDCFSYSHQKIVPVPSVLSLFNKKKKCINKVISFREIFDFGYWHFFADVLHKMYLLNAYNVVDKQTPILVSNSLASQPYFKFFAENTSIFDGREIIVQDEFLVIAEQAFFIKPMPHKPSYYFQTSELVRSRKGDMSRKRKVFLNRSASRGRFISNLNEVIPVLRKYDIEFVDADDLTLAEQIKLFSETSLLVGIHGAGFSNIMFRFPASLTLIEIFPWATGRFQIPPHYFLMSCIFGFSYQAIVGSHFKDSLSKSFSVNATELELILKIEIQKLATK